jgi:hypothetical protein
MSDTDQNSSDVIGLALAHEAVRWLASRCDGAVAADKQGFAVIDVRLGRALAAKLSWTPRELGAAAQIVLKYSKQLRRSTLDVATLSRFALAVRQDRARKLRVDEIVVGRVWICKDSQRLMLKSTYHSSVKETFKQLVGARWNSSEARWECDPTAENADALRELARAHGLTVEESPAWSSLVSARRVQLDGDRVVVTGVNAAALLGTLPLPQGDPRTDAEAFAALECVGRNAVAVPVKSWTIDGASRWLESLPPDAAVQIGWAVPELLRILGEERAAAVLRERSNESASSALLLDAARIGELRRLLPAAEKHVLNHQWVGVDMLIRHAQALLADEQGLGKTMQYLLAAEATNAFPLVVVAPPIALLNVRDEAERWLPGRPVHVAGAGVPKRDRGVGLEAADVIIVGYDSLTTSGDAIAARGPAMVVFDEGHYLKTHDSQRSEAAKKLVRAASVRRVVVSTGTLIVNRPAELLTLLTLVPQVLAALGGFKYFAARYCLATLHRSTWQSYWSFSGAANLEELATRLRQSGRFVRREKGRVLPSLPPKESVELEIDIDNRADYDMAAEDLSSYLRSNSGIWFGGSSRKAKRDEFDELEEVAKSLGWTEKELNCLDLSTSSQAEALRRVGVLRRLVGIGKVAAVAETVARIAAAEKVVVFAHHVQVQKALAFRIEQALSGGVLVLDGNMAAGARHRAVQRFQSDESVRVIICSLKAAQTAITLTAARTVVFAELDWTPAGLVQAEDRVHRIGQTGQVKVVHLVSPGTLDERMRAVISRKSVVIDAVLGSGATQ